MVEDPVKTGRAQGGETPRLIRKEMKVLSCIGVSIFCPVRCSLKSGGVLVSIRVRKLDYACRGLVEGLREWFAILKKSTTINANDNVVRVDFSRKAAVAKAA